MGWVILIGVGIILIAVAVAYNKGAQAANPAANPPANEDEGS